MWFLISHNRPEQCKAVIDQINSVGCTTPGVLWLNGLDGLEEYAKIKLPDTWHGLSSKENIGLGNAMNACFKRFPDEPFYGLICDDEYVYTPGWDTILAEAAGNWNFAHGNDGWQSDRRIHSYVTVGGDLVRECGWWSLPGLWHWFHDDVQELIAQSCGLRRYCPQVKTEHKHYIAGKVAKDKTYEAGESKNAMDSEIFHRWKKEYAQELITRIQSKCGTPSNIYNWVK